VESSDIFARFAGTKCEGCDGHKRRNVAFCTYCYGELPAALKNSLWKRFGSGFEEAYQACSAGFAPIPGKASTGRSSKGCLRSER
jgi:hypothetical protein